MRLAWNNDRRTKLQQLGSQKLGKSADPITRGKRCGQPSRRGGITSICPYETIPQVTSNRAEIALALSAIDREGLCRQSGDPTLPAFCLRQNSSLGLGLCYGDRPTGNGCTCLCVCANIGLRQIAVTSAGAYISRCRQEFRC